MMFNDGLILAIKCTKPLRDVRGKKFQSPMLSCCAIDISLLEHNAGNTQFYRNSRNSAHMAFKA